MKINVEVHLNIEGNRLSQKGQFEVNYVNYQKDPEFEAGIAAYKFIEEIKRNTGYRQTEIELVKLNGNEDITETVRRIRPIVDDSSLPF